MPLNSTTARWVRRFSPGHPAIRSRLKAVHHAWIRRTERRKLSRRYPGLEYFDLGPGKIEALPGRGFMSQYGQDMYLVENKLVPGKGGTFLDIGCNHPEQGSNSWHLEQLCGYSGLAIDPLGSFEAEWAETRPATRFIQAFVSASAGPLEFTEVSGAQGWESKLSGASDSVAIVGKDVQTLTRVIQPESLAELLKGQAFDFGVDVMFLDVEGHELSVLSSANWDASTPAVIVIENCGAMDQQLAVREYLENRRYRFKARIGIFDDVFVRS